jgi:hypothetical protein
MPTLLARPDAVAIYDGIDDGPLVDPQGNANRLYFHSSQPAPYRVGTYTGSFTRTWTSPKKITLQAHGLGYTPLVFGRVTLTAIGGTSASDPLFSGWASSVGTVFDLAGSVPVASFSSRNLQFALWFNLSADATNLYIIQINQRWAGLPGALADPELTFSYAIEAMSVAVAGTGPSATTGNMLEITPTSLDMGQGKFNSSRRYIRRASPPNYALASGQTIDVTGDAFRIGMRYSFNGYVRQGYRATDQGLSNAPTSSFNATVRSVKI